MIGINTNKSIKFKAPFYKGFSKNLVKLIKGDVKMNRRLLSIIVTLIMISSILMPSAPSFAASGDPQNGSWYRFEETVSGTSGISDGNSLDLDGAGQIKDLSGSKNGSTYNSNGFTSATYETSDLNGTDTVLPVPEANMYGISDNKSFVKFSYDPIGYKDGNGVDVGEFNMGTGITIEGWIYPTGDPGKSWQGQRIFTIDPECIPPATQDWETPGSLWAYVSGAQLCFGVRGEDGYAQTYSGLNAQVQYNKWNYIAISYEKNSNQVDFYVKTLDDTTVSHVAQSISSVGNIPDVFPNPNAHASFGYAHFFECDIGFQGYMDEMRLYNYKRGASELYIVTDPSKNTNTYRFEKTASNGTAVTDGALLSLDDPNGIRDEAGKKNGIATSGTGNVGTYESMEVANTATVNPAPKGQMKGITSNNFFAKLDVNEKQGISLGDLKAKTGLTIEGWIYPTGDKANIAQNLIISKQTGWADGNFYLFINSDSSLGLVAVGSDNYKSWFAPQAKLKYNKWNYFAITWNKDMSSTGTIDVYVKPYDNVMTHAIGTDSGGKDAGTFSTDNNSDDLIVGYNPTVMTWANADGSGCGFNGFVDELQLSDYAKTADELSVNTSVAGAGNSTWSYRFEATASGTTPVTSDAGLDLDGQQQVKDESGTFPGDAVSGNSQAVGTYTNSDAGVTPVPVEQMNGIVNNNFFAKLDATNDKQGIDLGGRALIGHGLTFEGWFCPTGDISNAEKNGLLIAYKSSEKGGDFWAYLNSEGGVTFKITGSTFPTTGNVREWKTAPGIVEWGKWNYIAIAVDKDRIDMDFYIKPVDKALVHQTVRCSLTPDVGLFVTDEPDQVTIGYNDSLDAGFDGYIDEIKITNYKLIDEELEVAKTSSAHQTQGNFAVSLDATPGTNIPTFGSFKRLVTEINGKYYASYQDAGDYEHIVQSGDGGHTWTDLFYPAAGKIYFSSPAVLLADKHGSLYAVGNGGDGNQLMFMKFSDKGSGMQLEIGPKSLGRLTTKFAAVYSQKDDVIYFSGRVSDEQGHEAPVHVFKIDTSGNILADNRVINSVGDWSKEGGDDYYDAQYQNLYCDDTGRLHMVYSVYNWPEALKNEWIYTLKHVLYMYSDDGGESWNKADGTPISIPFAVNDLENGGTMISKDGIEGWRAWGSSILVKGNSIHILYHVYDNNNLDIYQRYVRLNRTTGAEEQRFEITPYLEDMHSTLVSDTLTDKLYIYSEVERRPSVLVSEDNGDTWKVLAHALRPPINDDYYSGTAMQTLTSDGSIISLVTDWGYNGERNVVFSKINIRDAAIKVTGITVTGAGNATTVTSGNSLQMNAAILPVNATNKTVAWSVTNGTGTAIINPATGLLTATGLGKVTVKAASSDGSGIEGAMEVTILTPPPGAPSISVPTSTPEASVKIEGDSGQKIIKVEPSVNDKTHEATATLNIDTIQKVAKDAVTNENGLKTVSVEISKMKNINKYSLVLPKDAIASEDQNIQFEIKTELGTVILPGDMVKSKDVEGIKNLEFSISAVDKNMLNEKVKKDIGDRPAIDLQMKTDGKVLSWSNPDVPVKVVIPYKPGAGEDPEHITVWYIDGNGNAVAVPDGRYDSKTGTVSFITVHFSMYSIVYVNKTFNDLAGYKWAKDAIEVMASKGICDGTAENVFNPGSEITRGDFLLWLVRALGLSTGFDSSFDDTKAGDRYYEALGIAKKLGITKGTGKNRFEPEKAISRQDMMVLSVKAFKAAGVELAAGTQADIVSYADSSRIAKYAATDVASLVKAGLIGGDGRNLYPAAKTTRAEAAAFVRKIINKVVQ